MKRDELLAEKPISRLQKRILTALCYQHEAHVFGVISTVKSRNFGGWVIDGLGRIPHKTMNDLLSRGLVKPTRIGLNVDNPELQKILKGGGG